MILVTGSIDVDPDQRDAFIEAARKVMAASCSEDGCEQYVFSADLDDSGRFHISERWAGEDAMAAHMGQAHLAAFLGSIGAMVRGSSLTKWTGATGERLM